MSKLSTFLDLDREDRAATLEAMAGLLLAKAQIRFIPPRLWRERFGNLSASSAAAPCSPENTVLIRRVRLAIARALRNVPGDPNCLPQALAARRMLQRRGIDAQLYLGTQRETGDRARFHAWLKVGGEWVTGHCDESRYSLLAARGTMAG